MSWAKLKVGDITHVVTKGTTPTKNQGFVESGVNFIAVKGPSLVSKLVGETERAIRDVFAQARQTAPCILFFDEIDALATRRTAEANGAFAARVVGQFLTEVDGIEELEGVLVLGASNRPDCIDDALMRPGRFDQIIQVPPPDMEGRLDILKVHTRAKPLTPDVDLPKVAAMTEGMTGAELESVCSTAAMRALRRRILGDPQMRSCIWHSDFEASVSEVCARSDDLSA